MECLDSGAIIVEDDRFLGRGTCYGYISHLLLNKPWSYLVSLCVTSSLVTSGGLTKDLRTGRKARGEELVD